MYLTLLYNSEVHHMYSGTKVRCIPDCIQDGAMQLVISSFNDE